MGDINYLTELSDALTPVDLAVVAASLWQDAIIWQALQERGVIKKVAQRTGTLAGWTPANIALTVLGSDMTPELLLADADAGVENDLLQRALNAYDAFITGTQPTATLQAAAFIALALRERNRLSLTWQALFDQKNGYLPTECAQLMKTSLACLYGLVGDPDVLLRAVIAGRTGETGLDWACHCILTNPQPENRMKEIMTGLLLDLNPAQQVSWLRLLQLKGWKSLAGELGKVLTSAGLVEAGSLDGTARLVTAAQIPEQVHQLQQLATLHLHAGNKDKAREILAGAHELAQHALASIQIQRINLDDETETQSGAIWSGAVESPWLQAELSLVKGDKPWDGLLENADGCSNGFVLLRRASLVEAKGDRDGARKLAQSGIAALPSLANANSELWGLTGENWKPAELIVKLTEMDLFAEAGAVAEASLGARRLDLDLLLRSSEVFERLGKTEAAIDAARLLCMATPGNAENMRLLAALYERSNDWKNALQTRRQVLSMDSQSSIVDTLHVANAALQTGAVGGTIEVCRQVLLKDPDQGNAHALLGLALLQQGNRESAMEHLTQATVLAPEEARAWLALAEVQRMDGNHQSALQTLRAAVLAAPDSAELNYVLAQTYLESGQPSEALPFLWEASRLDASQAEVAWKLARTLHSLGHYQEARQVIDQARWRWADHVMVAVVDAEILMDAGQMERAIPALEVALAGENPRIEWYLMHARALLGILPGAALPQTRNIDPERLIRAQSSLEQVVNADAENLEGRILLAEVLHSSGKAREAYEHFMVLGENAKLNQFNWRWRVQAGLGRAALAMGEVETAVASLREATLNYPEDLHVQQALAEAYTQAKLTPEAVQAARQALVLDTENVENLGWFIDIMTRLEKSEETLSALEAVTRLAPEQAPFWNKLARVQLLRSDTEAAHRAMTKLLDIANLKVDDYRSCARTYLMMGNPKEALDCLEKAKGLGGGLLPLDMQYAAAYLLHRSERDEAALALAQDYAMRVDASAEARVMLADVLTWLNKPQEALTCLRQVLEDAPVGEAWLSAGADQAEDNLLPEGWQDAAESVAGVYARMATIVWASGELATALEYADKALDANPADAAVRLLAAELARGCGETAKALQSASDQTDPCDQKCCRLNQALVAIQAELALEGGEDTLAARLLEQHIPAIPLEPHLLALQSRLLGRMGDQANALAALEEAHKVQPITLPGRANLLQAVDLTESIWKIYQEGADLYLAEAALDLEQWGDANNGFAQYIAKHPSELRGFIRTARASVVSAEQQRLCEALRSEQHAPSAHSQMDVLGRVFEEAIARAEELCSENLEAKFWKVRGQAVFRPALQQAPAVAKLASTSENAAALLALLRSTKNAINAVRIAHHFPDNPIFLTQLALCYREVDVLKGLEAARKAVDLNPNYPLHYAALAQLEQDAGNDEAALDALEIALGIWADEPDWYAWAGELHQNLGEEQRSLDCWERALTLRPDSARYALVVGQKLMEFGNPEQAIEVLEHASNASPEESKVWASLAQAFRMAGRLDEALNCTNQASVLAPDDPASYLASGEIALQMGKPETALDYAHAAVACKPNHPAAVLFTSKVLVQKGQLAEGLTVLEKAMPVLHGSLPVMMERANLIRRLYGAQVALPLYLELAQLFPQDSAVLSMLAQTQTECGDLKAAERTAYSAHHINPEHPQLNYLLGRLQHASGQLDQAIHFLSEAIRQSPAEIESYLELGQAYLERREHLKALQTYQQAIKVSGKDYRPYYRAALVLRDCKDYVAAETMLRRAAELSPEDLNIRRQLGAVVALNLVHNTQEVNSPL